MSMQKREKVIAFFKELGFRPDVNRFEDRLVAQKLVCLLELKGIDLGYPCSMYVRGPYSPELTRDLYGFHDKFERFETEASLDAREKEIAQDLGEIFGLKPILLEIAATYGYYAIEERCDPIEALARVKRLKPFYSEAQVAVGISKAKKFLFEPTAEDMEELKRETGTWQRASLQSLEH